MERSGDGKDLDEVAAVGTDPDVGVEAVWKWSAVGRWEVLGCCRGGGW